jgi:hypothetical protein
MGEIKLSPESITALKRELVAELKSEGLILVHKSSVFTDVNKLREREAIMRLKTVTPSMIIKHQLLINVKSVRTIKNMVKDGRIKANEWLKDSNGTLQILTAAIKRLNNG